MHKCGKLDIVEGSSVETVYLAWIIGQNFCRGVVRHDAGWMVCSKFVEALSDSIGAWDSGIPEAVYTHWRCWSKGSDSLKSGFLDPGQRSHKP